MHCHSVTMSKRYKEFSLSIFRKSFLSANTHHSYISPVRYNQRKTRFPVQWANQINELQLTARSASRKGESII